MGDKKEVQEIPVVENHIYFYQTVEEESSCNLNVALLRTAQVQLEKKTDLPIVLHICSPGGDAFSGFSVVDTIKDSPVAVITIIEGHACSMAAKIALAGHKRMIRKHGYMMLHQLSSCVWGKYEEMKDQMLTSTSLMKMVKKYISENSKLKVKELDEMLKHDMFLNADLCLKYGLVDEIL